MAGCNVLADGPLPHRKLYCEQGDMQMMRRTGWFILIVSVLLMPLASSSAIAQSGADATTAYQLNMRTGPGTQFDVVTVLQGGVPIVLEGRNADISWVLGHTEDGAFRGWLASLYLAYAPGVSAARLPVTEEIVAGGAVPSEPSQPEQPVQEQAAAPDGVTAYTNYQMNVRSGPETSFSALGRLDANTGLILEARNGDSSWVLAHTADNSARGWLASLYIRFVGVSASSLPYSEEMIAAADGGSSAAPATGYDGIPMGDFDASRVSGIDLTAYPVVGRATGNARQIFLAGRSQGNNPHVLAKVGDCSSEHWYFLDPFAWGQYQLAGYTNLQSVVSQFGESLAYNSQATHNGFNANAVLSSMWADPAYCQAGETPLDCEFRLHKPSVAIIMFGTSDLLVMAPGEFDFYMREIVKETIDAGVIPILSTFPGNQGFWNRTILYNQIVIRIALDFDIPLINLWLALESLPNQGLEPDGFHLSEPAYGTAGYLTAANLSFGYTTRNLVTMQTLDAVWRGAMY